MFVAVGLGLGDLYCGRSDRCLLCRRDWLIHTHRNFVSGRKWLSSGAAGAIARTGSRERDRLAKSHGSEPQLEGCACVSPGGRFACETGRVSCLAACWGAADSFAGESFNSAGCSSGGGYCVCFVLCFFVFLFLCECYVNFGNSMVILKWF